MNRMTKILMSPALVLALGGFLAGPATAHDTSTLVVFVDVFKDKDIEVDVTIDKIKNVDILVDAPPMILDAAAQSSSIKVQINKHNTVDLDAFTDPDGVGFDDAYNTLMDHSVNHNTGITQFNQDVGNMVNQANVVSIALTEPDGDDTSFVDSQAAQTQINKHNTVTEVGRLIEADPDTEAILDHSVNHNLGITQVNQNSGNMNNQDNNLSVALGLSGSAVVALSEADLGQVNKHNSVTSTNTVKVADMQWSVRRNSGVTSVNQSVGNMNNQDTSISFAAFAGPATTSQGFLSITSF